LFENWDWALTITSLLFPGVDIDNVTKEELIHMLGREYHDVSTSAMSFVSSSSNKSVCRSLIIIYFLLHIKYLKILSKL